MLGSTVFILFIMLVAAANLCLGFAAAMSFGLGPKSQSTAETLHHATEEAAAEPLVPSALPVIAPPVEPASLPHHASTAASPATVAARAEEFTHTFDLFTSELTNWDQRRQQGDSDPERLSNAAIELNCLASGYLEQLQSRGETLMAALTESHRSEDCAELHGIIERFTHEVSGICAEVGSLQFEEGDALPVNEKLTLGCTGMQVAISMARDQLPLF